MLCFLQIITLVLLRNAKAHTDLNNVKCNSQKLEFTISNSSDIFERYGGNLVVFSLDSSCKVVGSHSTNFSTPGPFRISFSYRQCGVKFNALLGTGGHPSGYYTNQNFIIAGTDGWDTTTPIGAFNETFSVYCWIGARTTVHTGTNATAGSVGGGGGAVMTIDPVEMNVTDLKGNPVYDVTLGDNLLLSIHLKRDQHLYNATLPVYCYFSDQIHSLDTKTARLPFIVQKCPNDGVIASFDYIQRMLRVNVSEYWLNFKAFSFQGYTGGLLGITCEMLVCLNATDGLCHKNCWDKPHPPSVQHLDLVSGRNKRESKNGKPEKIAKKSIVLQIRGPATTAASPEAQDLLEPVQGL